MSYPMKNLAIARTVNKQFSMSCVFHDDQSICNVSPINSHNIQNNGILTKLAHKGHVCLPSVNANNDEIRISVNQIGISKASVFRCLCSKHDNELFTDIEDRPYTGDKKQDFLFAFKSLLFEYWKKSMSQNVLSKIHVSAESTKQMNDDYIYCSSYFNEFRDLLRSGKYDSIMSISIEFPYEIQFAASSTLNIMRKFDGGLICNYKTNYPFCHISIFPQSGKSYLLISWLKEDDYYYCYLRNELDKTSDERFISRINVLLPILCENIILSPIFWDSWSKKQQQDFLALCNPRTASFYAINSVSIDNWSMDMSFNLFEKILPEN